MCVDVCGGVGWGEVCVRDASLSFIAEVNKECLK